MFRSIIRLTQVASRAARQVAVKTPATNPCIIMPTLRKYSSDVIPLSPEEEDSAWIDFFNNEDIDTYEFIVGFMDLYTEDRVPEPTIVQSALYACRRLDNFPMAMRVLELVKNKCDDRKDIYDYLMQELQPTLDDLGLTTVEGMELEKVLD